jgi:hypothetical protein
MPIVEGYFGSEADGSPSPDYCTYCYQHGGFTAPNQTVDGMVQSSIDFMTSNLGYDRDEAARLSNEVIPALKRWA